MISLISLFIISHSSNSFHKTTYLCLKYNKFITACPVHSTPKVSQSTPPEPDWTKLRKCRRKLTTTPRNTSGNDEICWPWRALRRSYKVRSRGWRRMWPNWRRKVKREKSKSCSPRCATSRSRSTLYIFQNVERQTLQRDYGRNC